MNITTYKDRCVGHCIVSCLAAFTMLTIAIVYACEGRVVLYPAITMSLLSAYVLLVVPASYHVSTGGGKLDFKHKVALMASSGNAKLPLVTILATTALLCYGMHWRGLV